VRLEGHRLTKYQRDDSRLSHGKTWQPEAPGSGRPEHLQATTNECIEKKIDRVEGNLPVFCGHVAATLDRISPGQDDRSYGDSVDAVTLTLLNTMHETLRQSTLKRSSGMP
jgi:hypothetical protein